MVVDGHHRYEILRDVATNMDPKYDWTRQPINVYLTVRIDSRTMTIVEMAKTSRLLNIESSHSLDGSGFLAQLECVMVYGRSFRDAYGVWFLEARMI